MGNVTTGEQLHNVTLVEVRPIRTVPAREYIVRFYEDDPYCYKELHNNGDTWMLHGLPESPSRADFEGRVVVLQQIFDTISAQLGDAFVCPEFYIEDREDGPVIVAKQLIVEGTSIADVEGQILENMVRQHGPFGLHGAIREKCADHGNARRAFESKAIDGFWNAVGLLRARKNEVIDMLLDHWQRGSDRFPDLNDGNFHLINIDAMINGAEDPHYVLFDL